MHIFVELCWFDIHKKWWQNWIGFFLFFFFCKILNQKDQKSIFAPRKISWMRNYIKLLLSLLFDTISCRYMYVKANLIRDYLPNQSCRCSSSCCCWGNCSCYNTCNNRSRRWCRSKHWRPLNTIECWSWRPRKTWKGKRWKKLPIENTELRVSLHQ